MKTKRKVSLICTLLNEEGSVQGLLDSMLKQSYQPEEIIFVDAGSTDKTVGIIQQYAKENNRIKLFVGPGATRMQGRNIAIKNAQHEVIAVTDAGCVLYENWLEEIMKKIDGGAVAVAGNSVPQYNNLFEQCEGILLYNQSIIPQTFKKIWTPSSRSEAFLKCIWEEVKGYSEDKPSDDAYFHHKILDAGHKYIFAKDALVTWEMRKTWKALFKQFFNYGKWDAMSGTLLKHPRSITLFSVTYIYLALLVYSLFTSQFIFSLVLILLPVLHGLVTGTRVFSKTKKVKSILYGFGIEFTRRFGYLIGSHRGFLIRDKGNVESF